MTAVFVPLVFMTGPVGVFYRQFSITMATSIILSGDRCTYAYTGSMCHDIEEHPWQAKEYKLGEPLSRRI